MYLLMDSQLQEYIQKINTGLGTNERFFVDYARHYFGGTNDKILAIGGLRGTGKTTGLLQALLGLDALYICAQKGEEESISDYIEMLKQTEKKYIVIDEYTWIQDRKELDYYLYTCVQNGKRIAITGTESITLDFLNYGNLIHRIDMVHVTIFSYDEYLHVYHLSHSKENCKKYLIEGGVFSEYAITNYDSMINYVKTAIVDNLVSYLGGKYEEQLMLQVVYTVLYEAVCSSTIRKMSTYNVNHTPVKNYLDVFGIDADIRFPKDDFRRMVDRVAEILEQIGVVVKIQNAVLDYEYEDNFLETINLEKTPKYKTYIVNPSLTCQLIKTVYALNDIDGYILGNVYEACMMSYLSYYKLNDDKLYFIDLRYKNGKNKELDAVMVRGIDERYIYLFECKYKAKAEIQKSNTMVSKDLEEFLRWRFGNSEVDGRCFVYTGEERVVFYEDKDYLFTPIGQSIRNYSFMADIVENMRKD